MFSRFRYGKHRRLTTLCTVCGILILLLSPLTGALSLTSDGGDSDTNSFTEDLDTAESISDEFISLNELQNLDLAKLLEINFINKTVTHYRSKFQSVQSSLDDRVRNLFDDLKGS